jgi:choline kinase
LKAIILAAGRGSRMKNLTSDKPKCLVKLHGKPLLEWQLESMYKSGISEIAVVTGYKNNMLFSYNLVEFHNSYWASTQMVASLACASDWLENDQCIVSYGDIFYDKSAIQSLIHSNANIAVTYDPNWLQLWEGRFGDPLLDAETFRINTDGTLLEIGNKPKLTSQVQGQYMGLLRFTPDGWKEFQLTRNLVPLKKMNSMDMTETLQMFLQKSSMKIYTIPYKGTWGEVDTESDLQYY